MDEAPPVFAGPVKRSMTIAGHTTSISLEPLFWHALEERARAEALPLSALVARIDAERIARTEPPNLASAIRCWLLAQAFRRADCPPVP
ncbi:MULTISPECIES: ribbon-helix-helix domain-containing protein [Sphingobium]|uniref:DNA-binding ribbon-helix-helix protein n=1 Tax=Sphingobium lignivorans TaxID=2735886 RepID=A0ABR6NL09_9SPHN|nr:MULTISPECIES: ribbon-helix-helix domain-containing protein [Sphingobium]MBB5987950.1 putative DNA-binding ribbon-helix-helix protein [Sphingobium lignivorans]BAK68547.1 arylsulfate sulfotransferase-like protein [Sphingobium sp. SYK-6]